MHKGKRKIQILFALLAAATLISIGNLDGAPIPDRPAKLLAPWDLLWLQHLCKSEKDDIANNFYARSVRCKFLFDGSSRIVKDEILTTSGSDKLDQLALDSVHKALPFPDAISSHGRSAIGPVLFEFSSRPYVNVDYTYPRLSRDEKYQQDMIDQWLYHVKSKVEESLSKREKDDVAQSDQAVSVIFRLRQDGSLADNRILTSSGSEKLDSAMKEALFYAAPFAQCPSNIPYTAGAIVSFRASSTPNILVRLASAHKSDYKYLGWLQNCEYKIAVEAKKLQQPVSKISSKEVTSFEEFIGGDILGPILLQRKIVRNYKAEKPVVLSLFNLSDLSLEQSSGNSSLDNVARELIEKVDRFDKPIQIDGIKRGLRITFDKKPAPAITVEFLPTDPYNPSTPEKVQEYLQSMVEKPVSVKSGDHIFGE